MAITITDDHIKSDVVEDHATINEHGRWVTTGPILDDFGNPTNGYSRNQAITAMTLAEHLGIWGTHDTCVFVQTWHKELLTPDPATAERSAGKSQEEPAPHVRCLYCGSDEVFETIVTIDERQSEYAYECCDCHGVWAQ
jgi:hypothetical protein